MRMGTLTEQALGEDVVKLRRHTLGKHAQIVQGRVKIWRAAETQSCIVHTILKNKHNIMYACWYKLIGQLVNMLK